MVREARVAIDRAQSAQQMCDAAKRNGKQIIVGFQHRFDAKTKLIRDQIARRQFCKVLYVRAQALRRRGIPNWGVYSGEEELQGGGPMIDFGCATILEPAALHGSALAAAGSAPAASAVDVHGE
jgi:predicted dehydrogenase